MRLRRAVMKMKTRNDCSSICEKTGKLIVQLSGGAGYYLKLTPSNEVVEGTISVAVWSRTDGCCIGADITVAAGVRRANRHHINNIRRWSGEKPIYAI